MFCRVKKYSVYTLKNKEKNPFLTNKIEKPSRIPWNVARITCEHPWLGNPVLEKSKCTNRRKSRTSEN